MEVKMNTYLKIVKVLLFATLLISCNKQSPITTKTPEYLGTWYGKDDWYMILNEDGTVEIGIDDIYMLQSLFVPYYPPAYGKYTVEKDGYYLKLTFNPPINLVRPLDTYYVISGGTIYSNSINVNYSISYPGYYHESTIKFKGILDYLNDNL